MGHSFYSYVRKSQWLGRMNCKYLEVLINHPSNPHSLQVHLDTFCTSEKFLRPKNVGFVASFHWSF